MAMMEDNFSKLFESEDDYSSEKIISSFYETGKNINSKTEIPKKGVLLIAVLESYVEEIRRAGLVETARMVKMMIRIFKELMISADREGRKEAVSMLGAIREQIKNSGVLSRILGSEKG